MRVFVAGGKRSDRQPPGAAAGRDVATRSWRRRGAWRRATACARSGHRSSLMDGLDAASVGEAVARAEPDVVVHQMTALTGAGDPRRFDEEFAVTNELRTRGTDHLLDGRRSGRCPPVRRAELHRLAERSWQAGRGWTRRTTGSTRARRPASAARSRRSAISSRRSPSSRRSRGSCSATAASTGPGRRWRTSSPQLIRKRKLPIVGGGGGVWSFLHVDDAAAATRRGDRGRRTRSLQRRRRRAGAGVRVAALPRRLPRRPGRRDAFRPGSRGSRSARSGSR